MNSQQQKKTYIWHTTWVSLSGAVVFLSLCSHSSLSPFGAASVVALLNYVLLRFGTDAKPRDPARGLVMCADLAATQAPEHATDPVAGVAPCASVRIATSPDYPKAQSFEMNLFRTGRNTEKERLSPFASGRRTESFNKTERERFADEDSDQTRQTSKRNKPAGNILMRFFDDFVKPFLERPAPLRTGSEQRDKRFGVYSLAELDGVMADTRAELASVVLREPARAEELKELMHYLHCYKLAYEVSAGVSAEPHAVRDLAVTQYMKQRALLGGENR